MKTVRIAAAAICLAFAALPAQAQVIDVSKMTDAEAAKAMETAMLMLITAYNCGEDYPEADLEKLGKLSSALEAKLKLKEEETDQKFYAKPWGEYEADNDKFCKANGPAVAAYLKRLP